MSNHFYSARVKPRYPTTEYAPGLCRVPNCDSEVNALSASKVCRKHLHSRPFCQCDACLNPHRTMHTGKRMRIKTREELIAEGLLPACG